MSDLPEKALRIRFVHNCQCRRQMSGSLKTKNINIEKISRKKIKRFRLL